MGGAMTGFPMDGRGGGSAVMANSSIGCPLVSSATQRRARPGCGFCTRGALSASLCLMIAVGLVTLAKTSGGTPASAIGTAVQYKLNAANINAWYSEERTRIGQFSAEYLLNSVRFIKRKDKKDRPKVKFRQQ